MEPLDRNAAQSAADELNRGLAHPWTLTDTTLENAFAFRDFVTAFGFMTQVAILAESRNHHPDWHNVYRTVRVSLSTHDAGGLTARDFELAQRMSELAEPQLAGDT